MPIKESAQERPPREAPPREPVPKRYAEKKSSLSGSHRFFAAAMLFMTVASIGMGAKGLSEDPIINQGWDKATHAEYTQAYADEAQGKDLSLNGQFAAAIKAYQIAEQNFDKLAATAQSKGDKGVQTLFQGQSSFEQRRIVENSYNLGIKQVKTAASYEEYAKGLATFANAYQHLKLDLESSIPNLSMFKTPGSVETDKIVTEQNTYMILVIDASVTKALSVLDGAKSNADYQNAANYFKSLTEFLTHGIGVGVAPSGYILRINDKLQAGNFAGAAADYQEYKVQLDFPMVQNLK